MDREILFRGFHKEPNGKDIAIVNGIPESGTWLRGDLAHRDGKVYVFPPDGLDVSDRCEATPSTVGQYTGLTDKNGKKLFKGDIIRFRYWCNGLMCWVGVVEYDYGAMYVVRGGSNQECESPFEVQLSGLGAESIEVIGSVHDNPELIGGEGDV